MKENNEKKIWNCDERRSMKKKIRICKHHYLLRTKMLTPGRLEEEIFTGQKDLGILR